MVKLYQNLDSFVSGRNVVVIGPGCSLGDDDRIEDDSIVVRFNKDRGPLDIWATTFYDDIEAQVPQDTRFVLITVPDAEVNYWNPGSERSAERRDFHPQVLRFDGATDHEIIHPVHWGQLAAAMPMFPLSGIAAIAMLQFTGFRKCQIYGFDFYLNNSLGDFLAAGPQKVMPIFPFMGMHSYREAIAFLQRLTAADERFEWRGKLPLCEMLLAWERRQRWLYCCYQMQMIKNKVRGTIFGK